VRKTENGICQNLLFCEFKETFLLCKKRFACFGFLLAQISWDSSLALRMTASLVDSRESQIPHSVFRFLFSVFCFPFSECRKIFSFQFNLRKKMYNFAHFI